MLFTCTGKRLFGIMRTKKLKPYLPVRVDIHVDVKTDYVLSGIFVSLELYYCIYSWKILIQKKVHYVLNRVRMCGIWQWFRDHTHYRDTAKSHVLIIENKPLNYINGTKLSPHSFLMNMK